MADRILVATRKGLFTFRRQWSALGPQWTGGKPAFLGEPVSAVLHDTRDGALYAALRLGHFGVKLHRSENGGESWTELTPPPAFPASAAVGEDDAPIIDTILTLAAGGRDQPGLLWAGTIPGGLFKSADRGQSWSLVESLWNDPKRKEWMGGGYDKPALHSILVDPRDSRKLTLGVSTGGVWKSDDVGATWRLAGQGMRAEYFPPERMHDPAVQDVHRLSACAAAPDVVWCQHHNGIFRSTDAGETFTEISATAKPAAFGFAVAAHPKDPEVAWFVPAVKDEYRVPVDGRLVVTRASGGGRSFEALGDGLPVRDCYDLIYRHALDVDGTGDTLAMGSTTGNLWASDNGGQSWRQLGGHLPPIASVALV